MKIEVLQCNPDGTQVLEIIEVPDDYFPQPEEQTEEA